MQDGPPCADQRLDVRANGLSSAVRSAALRCPQRVTRRTLPDTTGHPPYTTGHSPCPIGTQTMSHWYTDRVPVGYVLCPSGVRTVSQWGTHRAPVGYAPYPSGVRTVSQWGTHGVPVGYASCRSGTHTTYRVATRCCCVTHGVSKHSLHVPRFQIVRTRRRRSLRLCSPPARSSIPEKG